MSLVKRLLLKLEAMASSLTVESARTLEQESVAVLARLFLPLVWMWELEKSWS